MYQTDDNGQLIVSLASNHVVVDSGHVVTDAGSVSSVTIASDSVGLAKEAGGNLASIVTVEGSTADAAITSNVTGTISGKARGIVAILADVWNSVSHLLRVSIRAEIVTAVDVRDTMTINAGTAQNNKVEYSVPINKMAMVKAITLNIPPTTTAGQIALFARINRGSAAGSPDVLQLYSQAAGTNAIASIECNIPLLSGQSIVLTNNNADVANKQIIAAFTIDEFNF